MKGYTSPKVEFIEFKNEDIITASPCNTNVCEEDEKCPGYVCPESYGNTCAGNPYGGS